MTQKEFRVSIPEGYMIDEENSTFECIRFKKVSLIYSNVKIYIENPYQSERVQKKLFSMGYEWGSGDREVKFVGSPYLYLDDRGKLTQSSGSYKYFREKPYKEIYAENI